MSKRAVKPVPAPMPEDEDKPRRDLPLVRKEVLSVVLVTVLALIVRLILIPAPGHVTDIATFEAWMNTLIQYGPAGFYANASFVDYPPGYMIVLWLVGLLYHATVAYGDFSHDAMRAFIKLPAVIADLGIGYLTYLIARRIWPIAGAVVAMAVFALNPASWLVSAFWGQADSVAAVFLVWSLYLCVTKRFNLAWVVLGISVLIKPQPLVVAPLLLLWQMRVEGITWRLAMVPVIGALVAYLGSVGFAPAHDPVSVISWLYERYHTGINVYPYNSVNALNLYSINRDFFQPDTQPISFFGLDLGPQYAWGMGIFVALLAATAWRLWRALSSGDADTRELTLYTACFVVTLGFFMVVTRQHERYLFTALALAPLLWNAAPVMRLATVILSATFAYNLFYALQYLSAPSPDLDPTVVHPLSLLNFVTLVVVAGAFLIDEVGEWVNARLSPRRAESAADEAQARRGPNPFEGLVGMTARDWGIAALFTVGTAVLLFWGIMYPKIRIFDEIYYARAAQEYIQHHPLYEWTHPPLTKLIVAAGAWFFGMFGYGDPVGARMGNAVMGTLTVPLLYAFAKRLFSSTPAAVTAVLLLLTSGYFYVQSRIATPEISVAFFALLTLYCFYRFWISSQIAPAAGHVEYPQMIGAIGAGAIIALLLVLVYAEVALYRAQAWNATPIPYAIAVAAFAAIVAYLALSMRRRAASGAVVYPDGTFVDGSNVVYPSSQTQALKSATATDGTLRTTWSASGVESRDGDDVVTWDPDGTIRGTIRGERVVERQRWGLWLTLAACALAAFISSKWDGLFGLVALWFVATACAAQQFLPSLRARGSDAPRVRFAWGNPIAIRLPLYIAASILGVLVIYVLTYAPNFAGATNTGSVAIGHGGFAGLLSTQYQMFEYHAHLVATHTYSSKWWTWPFELRPVSYYYTAVTGTKPPDQIVAEILGVPNPAVWLAGLVSVPWAAWLAWRERHKGVMLLVIAYFAQWLPWALSPRIDFLYNFYPNLAVICLCSAYVMVTLSRRDQRLGNPRPVLIAAGVYLAACLVLFVYFFPIWSGGPITWSAWYQRMWIPKGAPIGWI